MTRLTRGLGKLVDPSIGRGIVNGDTWFFSIVYPVLISILSRPFMYMSMMTIQSRSILLCVSFGANFDGDCVHIYYPQEKIVVATLIIPVVMKGGLIGGYHRLWIVKMHMCQELCSNL